MSVLFDAGEAVVTTAERPRPVRRATDDDEPSNPYAGILPRFVGAIWEREERELEKQLNREWAGKSKDTAKFPRLTDEHLIVGCWHCRAVLLARCHAEEHAADPDGLPELHARTERWGVREMPVCNGCWSAPAPRAGTERTDFPARADRRRAGRSPAEGEENPWGSVALRNGEDAGAG